MSAPTGYLTDILARKRAELAGAPPPVAPPRDVAPARPFAAALRTPATLTVVAEIKRRSPMKGELAPELDAVAMARVYETAGAAACSVLTDAGFDGTLDDLSAVRAAIDLPLLRKDFLIDPRQCAEARGAGADAVLLIVAALGGGALDEMLAAAAEAGLETLVEVHSEGELERAIDAGARLVGVNNRDLQSFEVHVETSLRLAPRFPDEVVRVSESGIADGPTARKVFEAGYDAVLVGEALVRSPDPAALLAELTACS